MNILFLHHSTGNVIWHGGQPSILARAARKLSPGIAEALSQKALLPTLLNEYNKSSARSYKIREQIFPKASPYGWHNYPYDYYNIWVKNGGPRPYMEEPTLEMITKEYQMVIFKHCYPVSNILPDAGSTGDINSDIRTLSNYKLQYLALRDKLHSFPGTKFLLFTGAAQVSRNISEEEAKRAQEFFNWVVEDWDLIDDNIHLWDLYTLETEGGIYLTEDNATSVSDSHPNGDFATKAARLLVNRIVDIIENDGRLTTLTGEKQ